MSYSVDNFFGNLVNIQNIRAYLKDTSKDKVDKLMLELKKLRSVKEVKFYSSAESHRYLKNSYMGEKYLELLPQEFFPSFIEIVLKDSFQELRYVKEVELELSKSDIVEVTSFGEKWLINFLSVKVGLKIFVMVLTFLLSVSIGSVIYNTINLKLYKFKDEIKIYNLVGATRSFIVTPFVFASIIEVTLSFLVAFILQYITFFSIKYFFLDKLGLIFIKNPSFFLLLAIYTSILVISFLASILSVFSFLDKMGAIGE
ncbi:MAG: permease-like cell division protein FtsX [Calditerrivibrio sp.]|nr:permease-like cell division protein FtsX [Calditerrivibrio sp.]